MRRSAAPSVRAAKRGRFIPPILGSRLQENGISLNRNNTSAEEFENGSSNSIKDKEEISVKPIIKSSDSTSTNGKSLLLSKFQTKSTQQQSFRSPFLNKQSPGLSSVNTSDKPKDEEDACHYFSVVWCKMSKKKHKKWDGDGILITRGRTAILKDLEGKEIAKGSGYKSSELATLQEGHTLFVGGKEIEMMGTISAADYMSGKCFHAVSSPSIISQENNRRNSQNTVLKPFNNPGKTASSSAATNQNIKAKSTVALTPRHSIETPGALVMPRPSASHQWENNKTSTQVVDVVIDPHIAQHLRPHQKEGVIFLYECVVGLRNFSGNGAILGDEMGLGKTVQCISLIWTLHKQSPYGGQPLCNRTLIITPGSLVKNWCSEFRKWLGNERMKVYPVTSEKRVKEFSISPIYPVLIISYEMFIRSLEEIQNIKFDLFICDEAHRLKNSNIKTTTVISALKTRRRILLTGTPIQNDLTEFHSLIDICNPGILGTQVLFRRVYEQPIIQGQQPNATNEEKILGQTRATELNRLTGLFFLRRTAEINNQYLPPKVETVIFCRPSQLQSSIYRRLLTSRLVRSCLIDSAGGSRHLVCIAALKKICNHPCLVFEASQEAETNLEIDESEEESLYDGLLSVFPQGYDKQDLNPQESGKLGTLSKMLDNISFMKERVVVVSNYTQTLDVIQKLCEARDYRFLRLDGNTATSKRQSLVDRFNTRNCNDFVFLLSSKAGGVGLNLIGASRLILYDIDWNPANDLQAMARVWRDGQKKKVYIYRLLTTGTIEEKIYQRQTTKQSLSGAVADAKKESKVEFSLEEIRDLFCLHENTPCSTHDLLQCRCTEEQTDDEQAISNQSAAVPITRACQLGVPSNVEKKHTSIAELMEWQHLPSPVNDTEQEDGSLSNAGDLITFMFRSETNPGNSINLSSTYDNQVT
ncbi:DNA repair and recombination protein RAD54B-like [Actinia tenebrosa]|uniref:DNA repair and recombination protein RAD54B-like n=1 Tax=Actinia tenebrosa TaxID=6105 RepID=A0A6P8HXC9_ACTTE|nr:DNA repair and recombination protein RAD54B-like [Actinia tenebrosa]XP_031557320.1 DNA repair and recombination protein RAD54B-like [Actinia tenebrosa]